MSLLPAPDCVWKRSFIKGHSDMPEPIRTLLQSIADLLFPRSCVHCQEKVENTPSRFLCRECLQQIHFVQAPACTTCGHPYFGVLTGPRRCPHCTALNPLFKQGKTLFLAKGPARTLLHELKYRKGHYVLNDLALIAEQQPHFIRYLSNARLVPVPLHKDKLRERGFNQSQLLAEMLAGIAPGSSVLNCLVRTRFTLTQTRLNRENRSQNMKNAFALAPSVHLNKHDQFILIDDVFTTGSTLNACAEAFHRAGIQHLKVATLGHG